MISTPRQSDVMASTLLRHIDEKIETLQNDVGGVQRHLSLVEDQLTTTHDGMIHMTDRMDRLLVRLDAVNEHLKILPIQKNKNFVSPQH